MKDYCTKNIRNIAVVGHGGEGKTTLVEALLFATGTIDRQGRVEDGTTTTDFDPEETRRTISISAALAPLEWKDTKVNLIDVPGYFDFAGEMVGPLTVAEGAIITVGAVSGLNVGAEKAWEMCDKTKTSRMIVINQMDRENANFDKRWLPSRKNTVPTWPPSKCRSWKTASSPAWSAFWKIRPSPAKEKRSRRSRSPQAPRAPWKARAKPSWKPPLARTTN